MAGGRPSKPTNLKVLHGDDKKNPQRVNNDEPVPSASAVRPPGSLSEDARAVWDRIAPDRIEKGVLTPWDVDAFAALCEALVVLQSVWQEARGPSAPGAPSPMSKAKDAVGVCSTLGGRFGWTPADRAKLTTLETNRDQSEDFLTG